MNSVGRGSTTRPAWRCHSSRMAARPWRNSSEVRARALGRSWNSASTAWKSNALWRSTTSVCTSVNPASPSSASIAALVGIRVASMAATVGKKRKGTRLRTASGVMVRMITRPPGCKTRAISRSTCARWVNWWSTSESSTRAKVAPANGSDAACPWIHHRH